jgi:DNA-binding transcriptional regulator PaaX
MNQRRPALVYLLKALLPYTRQNIMLNYKPKQFFYELSRASHYSEATLRTTLYRAQQAGFIFSASQPIVTKLGKQKLQPFISKKLRHQGKLMVIFDVPQSMDPLRRRFRAILRELQFSQVQQSVWMSSYDHRAYLRKVVAELGLEQCVQIYEAARLPL